MTKMLFPWVRASRCVCVWVCKSVSVSVCLCDWVRERERDLSQVRENDSTMSNLFPQSIFKLWWSCDEEKNVENFASVTKKICVWIFFLQKNEVVSFCFFFRFPSNLRFRNFNRGRSERPILLESGGRHLLEADGGHRRRGRAAEKLSNVSR